MTAKYRNGCGVCPECDRYLYNASGCPCGWRAVTASSREPEIGTCQGCGAYWDAMLYKTCPACGGYIG